MKHIEANIGNFIAIGASAIVGIAIADALAAWTETKFPNPVTSGYLKLRNLRFAVSGAPKKG